jgi:hypothetical protein
MANLTGPMKIMASDTSVIDSTATVAVGTRAVDTSGNEYIYLLGVASTAAGTWVSFDEAGVTTRLAADALGRVGIAMAAIVADKYGWYQIYGKNTTAVVKTSETITDNSLLYTCSQAGAVDDVTGDASGEMVIGAIARSTATSNKITVELNYPKVINAAIN